MGLGPGCGSDFGDLVIGQMREAGENVTEVGLKKLQVSSFKFQVSRLGLLTGSRDFEWSRSRWRVSVTPGTSRRFERLS